MSVVYFLASILFVFFFFHGAGKDYRLTLLFTVLIHEFVLGFHFCLLLLLENAAYFFLLSCMKLFNVWL